LTYSTPKQLLPIAGVAMIERVLGHLARYGITGAVLSLGYRPDAFLAAYPDGECAGVAVEYAVEPEPRGTGGGIAFAARKAGLDETFVVVNGDVLTGLDVGKLIAFHRDRGGAATVSLTPVDDPSRYGVVVTDDHGRVEAFIEKPPAGQAPTNLINAGTYVFEPSVIDLIPAGPPVSIERETFPALVARESLYALASDASWIDAGTPAAYVEANLSYAALDGRWVAGDAIIDRSATVMRSVVGSRTRIDAGARVEASVLLAGSSVGPDARVTDSVVGPGASIGAGAIVEALTVIGDGAAVAPGTRLDGARVLERAP
jgi:mannose-1-phosphate guanylyltransferase